MAVGIGKVFEGERLDFLEKRENSLVFNLMVTMINYWLNDLAPLDSFLLSSLVDILEILSKSAVFCSHFKSSFTLNNLMALTKLEFISAQTRSRIIKLISYLGKGEYRNSYQPRPLSQAQTHYQARRREEEGSRRKEEEGRRPEEEGRFQSSSSFQEIKNREKMIKPSSPLYPSPSSYPSAPSSYPPPPSSYPLPPSSYPPPPSSYPPPPSSYPSPSSSLPRNVTSNLMGDFIDLLEPSNSREMLVFAMQNLAPAIEAVTPGILDSDKRYLKCLNLIEIILPPELQQAQIDLLESVADNLRVNRAEDGLKAKV